MMKNLVSILILLLSLSSSAIAHEEQKLFGVNPDDSYVSYTEKVIGKSEEIARCLHKQGGGITKNKWRYFSNGCVDKCSPQGERLMCTRAFKMGCDCGPEKCWDIEQKTCVDNPTHE